MSDRRAAVLGVALLWALAVACNKSAAPPTTRQDATPRNEATQMTTDDRPGLRKVLTPAPETLAKHVSEDTRAKARAYLAAHPRLPQQIRQGLEASQIWLGMTAEEVRLVLGEPAGTEQIPGKAEHQAFVYPDEGWVFRFDDRGLLYEYVER
jgi:hypothetical protein